MLIVTDGTGEVTIMAQSIAKALNGNKVLIKDAPAFAGTDLLAADVFFIGCEAPAPISFSYLEEMLQHINLAGRNCGIFSPSSQKAVQYLKKILKSSEAAIRAEPLFADSSFNIEEWAAGAPAIPKEKP